MNLDIQLTMSFRTAFGEESLPETLRRSLQLRRLAGWDSSSRKQQRRARRNDKITLIFMFIGDHL
jgi:hypothetical protein